MVRLVGNIGVVVIELAVESASVVRLVGKIGVVMIELVVKGACVVGLVGFVGDVVIELVVESACVVGLVGGVISSFLLFKINKPIIKSPQLYNYLCFFLVSDLSRCSVYNDFSLLTQFSLFSYSTDFPCILCFNSVHKLFSVNINLDTNFCVLLKRLFITNFYAILTQFFYEFLYKLLLILACFTVKRALNFYVIRFILIKNFWKFFDSFF